MAGVAAGLHGLALEAHCRGELDRAARLMARASRLDATLAPLAAELAAQQEAAARAAAGAAAAPEEEEDLAPLPEPAAARRSPPQPADGQPHDDAGGDAGDHFEAVLAGLASARGRSTPQTHTVSLLKAGIFGAALLALLLHDTLGLLLLPSRGSAAWTAMVVACVTLPFARALPTTARRRHGLPAAAQGTSPKSPLRMPPERRTHRRRTVAAAEAAVRAAARAGARSAATAWERGATAAEAAAAAAGAAADEADEVARVLAARNHFDVLRLPRTAGSAAARSAYRATALRVHPDKSSSAGAAAAWERVQRAGEVLTDDDARDEYAALLSKAKGGAGLSVRRRAARSPGAF